MVPLLEISKGSENEKLASSSPAFAIYNTHISASWAFHFAPAITYFDEDDPTTVAPGDTPMDKASFSRKCARQELFALVQAKHLYQIVKSKKFIWT